MKNTIIHATWPFVRLKTRQSTILLTAFSANNGLLEVYKKCPNFIRTIDRHRMT